MARLLSRREFMVSSAAGAALLWGLTPKALGEQVRKAARGLKFFTEEQAKALLLAAAEIVPSDATPGLGWRGRSGSLNAVVSKDPGLKKLYTFGLSGMDAVSRNMFGKRFSDLTSEQRRDVLGRLEKGDAPGWPSPGPPSQVFFTVLRIHTVMAFYDSPAGDKDTGFPRSRVLHREAIRAPAP